MAADALLLALEGGHTPVHDLGTIEIQAERADDRAVIADVE